jgi:ATP-binding cassette subfamily C protein CydC
MRGGMKDLLQILRLWRGRAFWLLAGALASLGALLSGVGMMALGGAMLGAVITSTAASLALRGLGAARVVLRYTERLVTHDATFRALADLRVWFFRNLARSAAGGLGFRQAGDALARLVGDIETLDALYLRVLVPLAGAVLLLPGLVILIGRSNPLLAWVVGALFAAGGFLLPLTGARVASRAGATLTKAASGLRVAALDALTGLREVRAFGAEGRMLASMQAQEALLLAAQHELAERTALAGAGALLCGQAALLAVLISSAANPGAASVAAFVVVAAFEMVAGLPRAGVLGGHIAASAHRVLEAAHVPAAVTDPPQPAQLPAGTALRFDCVHFRWTPDRAAVFDGVTFEVPQGSRVALLGPSGSGKSTLAALALKVAAPQRGRVLLGDADIATLAAADVRTRIGWLAQATHLFDDTIRANLRLAQPNADDGALWTALDAAHIGAMVRALPEGLDTWVGEGGARFSSGQARRLALARALLSPASILILDEPCEGLDAANERAFLATLNEAADGRSVILITHRLIGVERLDRIWRLSGGKAIAAAA